MIIYALGDANADGKVDANDIVAIVDCLMGKPSASFIMKAADVNKDNKVDIADIIQIANTTNITIRFTVLILIMFYVAKVAQIIGKIQTRKVECG